MKDRGNLPLESIISEESKCYDYTDSFSLSLKRSDIESWELLAAFFQSAPKWVDTLFRLRNRLVSVFGLKADMANTTQLNPPFSIGQQLGVFRVYEIEEDEVVLGENDKHLDFRTSLFIERGVDNQLVISTIVKVNNVLGAIYFFVVNRVHQIIVPIMLNRMVKNIDGNRLPQYSQSGRNGV